MRLPWVARDDAIRAGFHGQLEQGFVVRVGEVRRPVGLELTLLSGGADGVQHVVNVSQRQFHFCGIAFGHFFVFEQEMIAQQQLPAIRAQLLEDFKRGTVRGLQRAKEDIRIHDGAVTWHGGDCLRK